MTPPPEPHPPPPLPPERLRAGAGVATALLPAGALYLWGFRPDLLAVGAGFTGGLLLLAWMGVAAARRLPPLAPWCAYALCAGVQLYAAALVYRDGGYTSPFWGALAVGMVAAPTVYPLSGRETALLGLWTLTVYGAAIAAFSLQMSFVPTLSSLLLHVGLLLLATAFPIVGAAQRSRRASG